jgi:glycosyltransferase involved in cell wall biosynthesis
LDWRRKKWGRVASAALRLGEWAAAALPNETIVVSRTLREYYRRVYAAETRFIPNGTLLLPHIEGTNLKAWGLEKDNYVLFLGRFSPEKNCDLLIRAFDSLSTDAKLVLAGGSSYTDTYVTGLRERASQRVHFLDWVSGDALQELLTNAAVFVLPSDLEGLSLALLDAMGAGVCVLSSDVPENRELVDDIGFTFSSGNQADLARMLQMLLSDPELRKRAGAAGRRRIQESYLWPEIVREVERVYLETVGRGMSLSRVLPQPLSDNSRPLEGKRDAA